MNHTVFTTALESLNYTNIIIISGISTLFTISHHCVDHLCRSIQKLEELNVGMEDLGEDVQALAQQCNGTAASGAGKHTPESGSGRNKTAVISSTPQKGGARGVPSLDESPVLVNQRFLKAFHPTKLK